MLPPRNSQAALRAPARQLLSRTASAPVPPSLAAATVNNQDTEGNTIATSDYDDDSGNLRRAVAVHSGAELMAAVDAGSAYISVWQDLQLDATLQPQQDLHIQVRALF